MNKSTSFPKPNGDPNKALAIAFSVLFVICLPIVIWIVAGPTLSSSGGGSSTTPVSDNRDSISVEGEFVYQLFCAECHGPDGTGVEAKGVPVRNSAFVQQSDDAALFEYLTHDISPSDVLNKTGKLMPGRAGKGLSDGQIRAVIAYLRTMQDPSQPVASIDAWLPDPSDSGAAQTTQAELPGYKQFVAYCSACHGTDAKGLEGLGKPLDTSAFVASKSDKDLMTFIKTGRPIWDAENTTGVDMPPKGGNPALSDEELTQIIGFLRAVHHEP